MGKAHRFRRGMLAAFLLALFLFPTLELSAAAAPGMSCCRGKTKCCCGNSRKQRPALSERTCGRECGPIALGRIAVTSLAAGHGAQTMFIPYAGLNRPPSTGFPRAMESHPLRQRPPPSSGLSLRDL